MPEAQIPKPGLFQCVQPRAQACFIASGSVLVQHAVLDGLIQSRNGFAENLLGCRFVSLCQGLAQVTESGAQARVVATIALSASFGLTSAFQRRKMICHCW